MTKPIYNPASVRNKAVSRHFTGATITADSLGPIESTMTSMMMNRPFYAALILGAEIVPMTEGTAAVDGKRLLVNEEWLKSREKPHREFILCHEALHNGFAHHVRLGGRDPEFANVAMDAAINQYLIDDGLNCPPDGITVDGLARQYGWDHATRDQLRRASWEEIYAAMMASAPEQPNEPENGNGEPCDDGEPSDQPGNGQGKPVPGKPDQPSGSGKTPPKGQDWGKVEFDTEASTAEQEEAIAEAQEGMQHALAEATVAGSGTEATRRATAEACKAVVDWKAVLRNTVQRGMKVSHMTYAKLPRKLSTWRLPVAVKEGVGRIICLIDKSGSVGREETMAYVAEMQSIIGEMSPEGVVIMPFDDEVKTDEIVELAQGEELTYIYECGGGTNFHAALEGAAEYWQPGDTVLLFTDMDCSIPDAPEFADTLIWVAVGCDESRKPPYGQYVPVPRAQI
jgi:predicted metal-dependent peptidase